MGILLRIDSENGTTLVKIKPEIAGKIKSLLQSANGEEWPDEVNSLLDEGEEIEIPRVNTCGDGWGWFDPRS
jgi:hypothetical protein